MVDFIIEFWAFVKVRKKYWLLPTIIFLFSIGFLLVASEGPALAPLIYAIF